MKSLPSSSSQDSIRIEEWKGGKGLNEAMGAYGKPGGL